METITRHELRHLREYDVPLSDKMSALNRARLSEDLCRRIRRHDQLDLFLLTDEAQLYCNQLSPYFQGVRPLVLELEPGHWLLTVSYPNGRRLFSLDINQEEPNNEHKPMERRIQPK